MSQIGGKRKISQVDLRQMMNQKRMKLLGTNRKIDSPLAKYGEDGSVHCILCSTVVGNELQWNVHVHSKIHNDNIAARKQRYTHPNSKPVGSSWPSANQISHSASEKKVKGILKNKSSSTFLVVPTSEEPAAYTNGICQMEVDNDDEMDEIKNTTELPEGFFDDPILDAKARKVEYKDPIEEEWEKFQKEIREETLVSSELIEEDQEEAATGRQIEEIDEQMHNWSRVLDLEVKKEKVREAIVHPETSEKDEDEDSSYGSEEEPELFNWRSKRAFTR